MWNVSDYLLKYNSKRLYSFIPYVGFAAVHAWDFKNVAGQYYPTNYVSPSAHQSSLAPEIGIFNNFRFSDRISLGIDISGALLKENTDKQVGGDWDYDVLANASASLVFKLGKKTDFSEALLLDQGLIDDLNNQINRLRQENDALRNAPKPTVSCPDCPKCPEPKPVVEAAKTFVSNVVFFRLGSAVIDKNQEVSIYNTAKYLQDNPGKNVKIVGYADKKTGTASVNLKLSEKRAKNVANALINKYNISSNRVKVEWKGDTEQPYAENAWNRVAIFFAE
jgi:outer membrane protein OmpA-like peptidoglycan-associated protein